MFYICAAKKQKIAFINIEMKRNTLFILLAAITLSLICSCSHDNGTVSIKGTVNDAKGELLTLMHLSGSNPVMVDTLRLGEDGKFSFNPQVEQGGPDFFCLVLNGQTIPVISDTLQTPISIIANKDKFSSTYIAEDSLNNALKQAVSVGGNLRRQLIDLTAERQNGKVSNLEFAQKINDYVDAYKQQVLRDYIYKDPSSPVCYYLLFETVSGMTIFDPLDVQDNKAYGAVANLWHMLYPNSPRTSFLEQRAIEGQVLIKQARENQQKTDSLLQNVVVNEASFVDLQLLDKQDKLVSLSSINGKGNVVLLDFTAFYYDMSVAHNMALSKVYDRFKNSGLKIYQVCLDFDENFWKVSANNLPWTVVRDRDILLDQNGLLQYSGAAALYNVTTIPTVFIMGRDGSILERIEDDSKLEAAVAKAI